MDNKTFIAGYVVLLLLVLGSYFYPAQHANNYPTPNAGTISTANGTVFNSAKIAETGFPLTTGNATTTSTALYNGDANDRIISSTFAFCSGLGTSQTAFTGTGLKSLSMLAATSSDGGGLLSNTNYVYQGDIATSSPYFFEASTTPGKVNSTNQGLRTWAAGTYLMFQVNATNTANCIVGAHYYAS